MYIPPIQVEKMSAPKINFNQVIGLETVKKELFYYIDFINNRNKYIKFNVKLPKGILLIGNPGTGKTLLVKGLATEAKIPFIYVSGSEFVEIYVGMGASRVRNLFSRAKKYEKCIIFIDEIDAIGRKRTANVDNSERDNTLNQLLVEMDGFDDKNNIMIFAATNLHSTLDGALTRSGRFDKKIYFDLPNLEEREKMLLLYLDGIQTQNIDLIDLAKKTSGLSGADICNICNQAKILAIKENNEIVDNKIINNAIDEILIGREKPERKVSDEEKKIIAHHEAGHAFMSYILKTQNPPIKVSIMPRGENALGFSQQEPEDKKLQTEQEILQKICVLYGGRIAEEVFFNVITTGAYDDIEKATNLIEHYIMSFGMDKQLGLLNYNKIKNISNKKKEMIDNKINEIINKCYQLTRTEIEKHQEHVKILALLLLEKETIFMEDIETIIPISLKNSV